MDNTFKEKMEKLLADNKVVLFVKGTPEFPQCGFSNQVMQIFKVMETPFITVDILSDDEVRQGMKVYSNWPTFPQIYVNGEFIGGCDIVTEMYQSGALQPIVEKALKAS